MQREHGVRVVLEIDEGVYKRVVDAEDHHDRRESEVGRHLNRMGRSTPPDLVRGSRETIRRFSRLTEYMNNNGGRPSVLGLG